MYKANRNLLPPYLNDFFKNVNPIHTYHTRNKHDLYCNKSKTFVKGMSPCIRGIKWYNDLSQNIKESQNLTKFKQNLKANLLSLYNNCK